MTMDDRMKLRAAGFIILRVRTAELKIVQMTGNSAWSTFGTYESKTALKKEINRINDHEPLIIFEYAE